MLGAAVWVTIDCVVYSGSVCVNVSMVVLLEIETIEKAELGLEAMTRSLSI